MTVIKIYQCDVCGKQLDKFYLYRFNLSSEVSNGEFIEDMVEDFDICKKCYKRIVKQIRKEDK